MCGRIIILKTRNYLRLRKHWSVWEYTLIKSMCLLCSYPVGFLLHLLLGRILILIWIWFLIQCTCRAIINLPLWSILSDLFQRPTNLCDLVCVCVCGCFFLRAHQYFFNSFHVCLPANFCDNIFTYKDLIYCKWFRVPCHIMYMTSIYETEI